MRSNSRRLAGVALAFALAAAAVAIAAASCQNADCSCTPSSDTTTTMNCRWSPSGAAAGQLPEVTSANVTAVYFTKYNLGALANSSFTGSGQQRLRQIVTLSLDNNGIASIERNALSSLTGLVSLSAASNKVQQLPARVFDGLSRLRQLDLRNNALDTLSGDTFVGLSQLRQLDLSGNALRYVPSAAFAPLQSLERLDLSSNFIESFAGDFLSGLTSLTWISLSSNRLTTLSAADGGGDGSLFAAASRLQALDVSRNRLAQLPAASGWLSNLTSLVALNLTDSFVLCDCGAALALRTWLDTTAAAAPIKSDWVANPARSGTCIAPPTLAGTHFVNVPAVSLACVATTSAAAATSSSTSRATTAAAAPSPASSSVAGVATAGSQAAVTQEEATMAATVGSVLLSGSVLAIVLGCSLGAAVLLVVILVTWAVRRRLKRGLQQRPPPASSKTASARPKTDSASAAAIAAAIFKSDGLRQDGGGWSNGAYTSSPSTDSPNGGSDGGGGRLSGQPALTLQSPSHLTLLPPSRADAAAHSSGETTDAGRPAHGYYDRVAADLKEGATTGEPRSPVRMNGLLPYAYTRQNSARSTAIEQARAKAMLQLGSNGASASRRADDLDRTSASSASATLRFYSSHGALSPTTSSSTGGGDIGLFSAAAGDCGHLRRSLPRSLAIRSEPSGRNAKLTASVRLGTVAAVGGRELARSLSGAAFDDTAPLDADVAAASTVQHSLPTPHHPDFWSPESSSPSFYENVGPPLVATMPSVLPHEVAAVALQPPGTPRTPSWPDGASTQFSFSPQPSSPEMRRSAPAPPLPADYSTMGSSRSLSAASGSLHSGHGSGRVGNDLKRFVNDTPV